MLSDFPSADDPNASRERRLALALATVAGFADVVGYLTLHHLFTAHMTGNASKLGVRLGHGQLERALPLAVAPFLFVAGIALGTVLADTGRRWAAFALQALLTGVYMGYGVTVVRHGVAPDHAVAGFYVLAVVAIVGLGLQTAALTEIGGATVRTTYVSGVLTHLAQTAVRHLRGRRAPPGRLRLLAGLWLAYIAGATLASFLLGRWSLWCLALPLAALAVVAIDEARAGR